MFFYEHIFYLFSYIHRAHNIFSRDACSLGNVFPLNVLHVLLLVIFQHNNMNSRWMLCSQIVAEQVDVSVLLCKICDFDICVKLRYFKKITITFSQRISLNISQFCNKMNMMQEIDRIYLLHSYGCCNQ